MRKLISIRKEHDVFSDHNNVSWLESHNRSIVGFKRFNKDQTIFCLFNYSAEPQKLTYYVLDSVRESSNVLIDLWAEKPIKIGNDNEYLEFEPYQFFLLKS